MVDSPGVAVVWIALMMVWSTCIGIVLHWMHVVWGQSGPRHGHGHDEMIWIFFSLVACLLTEFARTHPALVHIFTDRDQVEGSRHGAEGTSGQQGD